MAGNRAELDASELDERIRRALQELSIEQKVSLVSGGGFWTTVAIPEIGLRAIVFSDGPAGVRGETWDERQPSTSFAAPVALGATWSRRLAAATGIALAQQARNKGVDVLLGPTLNLQRSPRGGRNHESLGEDPLLVGVLASEIVRAMQSNGVAAAVKHYVLNDTETDRRTLSAEASARALHELYLAPFESAVRAGAWAVMSAYNSVNGTPMSENRLLSDPLVRRWGFDGVVVSDWSSVESLDAAVAAQHLAMPGPNPVWSTGLARAVELGQIAVSTLDDKVARILRLANRVGAWLGAPRPIEAVNAAAIAHQVAAGSIVLLQNDGSALPIRDREKICLVGYRARYTRQQGGGSARVVAAPEKEDAILHALRRRFGESSVSYEVGSLLDRAARPLPVSTIRQPDSQEAGVLVRYHFIDGTIREEKRLGTELIWLGTAPDPLACRRIEVVTDFTPAEDEQAEICIASTGRSRLEVDGRVLIEGEAESDGVDEVAALMSPPQLTSPIELRRGRTVRLRLMHEVLPHPTVPRSASVVIGTRPVSADPEELIAAAVENARTSDIAIVVVGTGDDTESEGRDREVLSLDGDQNALVERIAAVNPRTVVVVNTGSPVLMPWADRVAGIVVSWLGGDSGPAALADVLSGDVEPSGRLPSTWPAAEGGPLDPAVHPTNGVLKYAEDLHGGYRSDAIPAFPFGYGISYSSLSFERLAGLVDGGGLSLSLLVRNHGQRPARAVPQVYLSRARSLVDRPARKLIAFDGAVIPAGRSIAIDIDIPERSFRHWDQDAHSWLLEPGVFRLTVGQHALDSGLEIEVRVDDTGCSLVGAAASRPRES